MKTTRRKKWKENQNIYKKCQTKTQNTKKKIHRQCKESDTRNIDERGRRGRKTTTRETKGKSKRRVTDRKSGKERKRENEERSITGRPSSPLGATTHFFLSVSPVCMYTSFELMTKYKNFSVLFYRQLRVFYLQFIKENEE